MKGLLSIAGLVIALFVSSVNASIYDIADYQPVVTKRQTPLYCTTNGTNRVKEWFVDGEILNTDTATLRSLATECDDWAVSAWQTSYSSIVGNFCRWGEGTFSYASSTSKIRKYGKMAFDYAMGCTDARGVFDISWYVVALPAVDTLSQCEFPYSFGYDYNGDNEVDRCYDPNLLNDLSNCRDKFGSILPVLTNISTSVCKTDPDTGARCGYTRAAGSNSFSLDLEADCFGDNPPPDYDDGDIPEPNTCEKMSSDLMVCAADPNEKCDFYTGVCQSDCGYVNDQFVCFSPCEGAECDAEEPPDVNCTFNPSHPSCANKEPDLPENCTKSGAGMICKEDPAEKCNEQGICQDGCGYINDVFVCYKSNDKEGDLFKDLAPLIDELKNLGKKFDFTTSKPKGRESFGSFDSLFGEADLAIIKDMALDKKDEANQLIKSIKSEFTGMFSVSSPSGAYEQITLNLSYGTFKSKVWEFFQQNVGIIAAAVMAFAWMAAASIVMGGRND
ncbi:hypothetical protein [Shewanella sp.]|uniref:hypothetical protein n=1 Tax=Shewanella sp. TaxID=50422 RepID=UPI00356867D2